MAENKINDPKLIMTHQDLEQIRSLAIDMFSKNNPKSFKMEESQFRTYCYVMAVQNWLRSRDLLKIIID
jgi:hypothetical protein